jgi:UDP-N-acetylmuramate--alanine ligase
MAERMMAERGKVAQVPVELPATAPFLGGPSLRIHIVGIGGAGMNAIASVLASMGHVVSGSDNQASPVLERLSRTGVRAYAGHDATRVGNVDLVAFSTAVSADNVELAEARRRGIPVISRAEILGSICRERRTLAVSGTHGKTTTTAMLACVLAGAGLDPGFIVGGELLGGNGGAAWGSAPWFVVEADESDGTFLRLGPEGVVVTSVAPDHLDQWGDMAALAEAFEQFVRQATGPRVVCLDDDGAAALCGAVARGGREVTTYGTSEAARFRACEVQLAGLTSSFEIRAEGRSLGRFSVPVPGLHNVRNATAALAMATAVGVAPQVAQAALKSYAGVGRRFERRGCRGGVTYVDDYAHNPGKVRAALAGARQGDWQRVVAVFQPHRYSRTAARWRDFADAFVDADVLVVTDIYAAGEVPVAGVTGLLVADAVREAHPLMQVEYAATRAEVIDVLLGLLRPGDLCLTMGAGDITTLPTALLAGEGSGGAAGAGPSGGAGRAGGADSASGAGAGGPAGGGGEVAR